MCEQAKRTDEPKPIRAIRETDRLEDRLAPDEQEHCRVEMPVQLVADVDILQPFSARAVGVATEFARHDTRQPGLPWAITVLKGNIAAVTFVRQAPTATRCRWWQGAATRRFPGPWCCHPTLPLPWRSLVAHAGTSSRFRGISGYFPQPFRRFSLCRSATVSVGSHDLYL